MDRSIFCGCKGVRTCLNCETKFGIERKPSVLNGKPYSYCFLCDRIYLGSDNNHVMHSNHVKEENSHHVPGILIIPDFITKEEEKRLIQDIDNTTWDPSQSGRKKQNYGPKCNFKKQKIKSGSFQGFPKYTKFIQDRFKTIPELRDFKTIEQCSLEYDPTRGSSIDLHVDDCWVWGNRIVTLNLLSDTDLTMVKLNENDKSKYNLHLVHIPPSNLEDNDDIFIKIPMIRRSLAVLYGEIRYSWKHCILRDDITERRVCIAYREFTPPYLPNGENENEGKDILSIAENFW